MPHLVYSDEEIESCLHFILLNVNSATNSSNNNNRQQQQQQQECWWPCLVLEHMDMLHGVCRQKHYMQTDTAEADRRAAFVEQCRVRLMGATVRPVVLLLGPSPPARSRFLFSNVHHNNNKSNKIISSDAAAGDCWTLRPMMSLERAALYEWCSSLEKEHHYHHHTRAVDEATVTADDSLELLLRAAWNEVPTFLARARMAADWDWGTTPPTTPLGERDDDDDNDNDGDVVVVLPVLPPGEPPVEHHRTVAIVEP